MFVEFSRRLLCVIALGLPFLPTLATAAQEDLTGLNGALDEPFAISYSEIDEVPENYRRQIVPYETTHPAGTLIIDTGERFLYFVLGDAQALRYGIGVGRDGFQWSGTAEIGRKAPWPRWTPPKAMVARDAFAAKWAGGMPGGPKNPLGARALYLYDNGIDTLFRIHGTNQPSSIGQAVSSGCVRMLNADIVDLYGRVDSGSKVVVLKAPATITAQVKKPKKISQPNAQAARLMKQRQLLAGKKAMRPAIIRKTNFNLRKPKLASR